MQNKKIEPPEDRKNIILMNIVKSIFGLNAELDFSKWEIELDNLTIQDIDFNEDLLTVLQRLRDKFYVSLDTEEYEDIWDNKPITRCRLNLELIVKE